MALPLDNLPSAPHKEKDDATVATGTGTPSVDATLALPGSPPPAAVEGPAPDTCQLAAAPSPLAQTLDLPAPPAPGTDADTQALSGCNGARPEARIDQTLQEPPSFGS